MTLMEKLKNESSAQPKEKPEKAAESAASAMKQMQEQFKEFMTSVKATTGFGVDPSLENVVETNMQFASSKDVLVAITILLSYIRYCINHNVQKDITVKIGHNKPPSLPFHFVINDELLDEIYPGDEIEIN